MTTRARALLVMVLASAFAAGVGGWVGARWGSAHQMHEAELHVLLHHRLHLSADQERRLSDLETSFASQQQTFDSEMRGANQDLATALAREHTYGPHEQQAVQHFHQAMEGLQEATIKHVVAMRAILTPEQAEIFDRTIDQALTVPGP